MFQCFRGEVAKFNAFTGRTSFAFHAPDSPQGTEPRDAEAQR
jgi:hypothetical protein